MTRSWRTTTAGLATLFTTIAHVLTALTDGKPIDWTIVMTGFTTGFGLLSARDHKVTSEQAGLKPEEQQ